MARLRSASLGLALLVSVGSATSALAYIDPASVILERAASRRAQLGFGTVVAHGISDRGDARVWLGLRGGKVARIELQSSAGTQVELTRGRARFQFQEPGAPGSPGRLAADPLLELLGHTAADPGGRRGIDLLSRMGVDPQKVRLDLHDGHPAYVIGADPGDARSPQLWIDKRLLVPVRWVTAEESAQLFGYHLPTTGPWFPERIERTRGGRPMPILILRTVEFDPRVDERRFAVPGAR